jgi:uncharacterized protein (TIGR02246 family)
VAGRPRPAPLGLLPRPPAFLLALLALFALFALLALPCAEWGGEIVIGMMAWGGCKPLLMLGRDRDGMGRLQAARTGGLVGLRVLARPDLAPCRPGGRLEPYFHPLHKEQTMSLRNWCRRAVPLVLAASVVVPSIVVGQGIDSPRIPLRTALADLNTLRTAYVESFNARDAKAVAEHFTDDAIMITHDGKMMTGKAEIAKGMAADADNWPHAVIKSDSVRVYGATAIDVGTWTEHPAGGGENVTRYLAVLRHDMNGWKLSYVADVPVK